MSRQSPDLPGRGARLQRLGEETAQLFDAAGEFARLGHDDGFGVVPAEESGKVAFVEGSTICAGVAAIIRQV